VRGVSLFEGLQPEQKTHIQTLLSAKVFEAEEIVCPPDAHHTHLFFVASGRVKQYTISQDNRERILHIFKAGDAFGGLLIGNMEEFSPWIQAMSRVEVLILDEVGFESMIRVAPSVGMRLFRHVVDHHVEDMRRLERFIHMKARDRLLLTLVDLSERLAEEGSAISLIDPQYTHEELGNMLGLVRTTVSELMADLRSAGIIETQGRQLYINLTAAHQALYG
jgi:CRP/FNR family transcriptional regulator/CRP/FNR family cyclic AMP-dependent transcriptional regulator